MRKPFPDDIDRERVVPRRDMHVVHADFGRVGFGGVGPKPDRSRCGHRNVGGRCPKT
jgi:hypothetical protein